jgi:hypothetical protein
MRRRRRIADDDEGLSRLGIRALGFDEMCRCGHEYGLHDPYRCAVLECECRGFVAQEVSQ